jgi:hypothetical protein
VAAARFAHSPNSYSTTRTTRKRVNAV